MTRKRSACGASSARRVSTRAGVLSSPEHCSAERITRVMCGGIAAISAANSARKRSSRAAGPIPSHSMGLKAPSDSTGTSDIGSSPWFAAPGLDG